MRDTIDEYSEVEIHNALYHDKFIRGLWIDELMEVEELFTKHSNSNLKILNIPRIWAPIIKKLIKELVKIDPDVCITQIKEDTGRLYVHIKPMLHENQARLALMGAAYAVNTVTLIQLQTVSNR